MVVLNANNCHSIGRRKDKKIRMKGRRNTKMREIWFKLFGLVLNIERELVLEVRISTKVIYFKVIYPSLYLSHIYFHTWELR